MTDAPRTPLDGAPLAKPEKITFGDLRNEIDNQRDRYQRWRDRNADENPACHTLAMLDRFVATYAALGRLVERVSADPFILERLRELAEAERQAAEDAAASVDQAEDNDD